MVNVENTLSVREAQVVALLVTGLTNAGIGRQLGTTERTVRNQLHVAYRKMGVDCRAQAVVWYMTKEREKREKRQVEEQNKIEGERKEVKEKE